MLLDFLFFIAVILFFVTLALVLICCAKLTDFNGVGNNGKFYPILSENICRLKDARLLGKIILLPFIVYLAVVETMVIVITMILLSFACVFKFLFNKDETLVKAFCKTFNFRSWDVLNNQEKSIGHSFMGYVWFSPITNG